MTTHGRAPSLSGPGLHHPAITPSTGGRHGNISNPIAPSGDCFGIWPPGGQEYYANGCYGHDEPGIQFYSSLAGSGGNVSWNVTLPVSRDPADTQSDLYTAIWFGMTLSDPFAWMDQCFLELQFYPDSDWYSSGSVYGSWVGAAVAWQIEALTGYEDACYYQQLVQANQNELLMTQGDQIFVTMSGWVGDPYGENLTIEDRTQHEWSNLTMFNSAQNYPLDPAYVTNSYPNGLQWTPGGEYPVVFAYEVGHTSSPFPNNNSYGGCSAGTPPSTIVDPAVPCPSYDPTSWANDTVRPWRIAPPVFFNATRREQPAQVAFTQDLGGISLVDWLSNYTCVGREGSAFCSYPWYSYSCADRAFEFGATDWPTTSVDFGGYNEYSRTYENDALQQGFYPPTNFSIPACGQPSYSVTIGPGSSSGGAPYFLSQAVPVNRTFSGLAPGEYALAATVAGSENFLGWVSQGKIWASDNASPTTTLWVEGNGSVYATFTALPIQKTSVSFVISPTSAKVVILPSLYYTTGVPIATVSNGGSVTLAPGTYSIQAYPPAGYNFSSWTIQGPSNAAIAAPAFPYTWLVVPGTPVDLTVHSTSVTSSSTGVVYYGTYYGSGKVSFDGSPVSSGSSKTVSVGTYTLVATPGTGYAFDGWYVSSSGVLSDFRAQSNVTIENGTTYYAYAFFEPSVEIRASPSADGRVSLDSGPPVADQTSLLYPGYYTLTPAPEAGYAFSSWSVSSTADVWVYRIGAGYYGLEVNYSATVTANFVGASAIDLSLNISPAGGGTLLFNFQSYTSNTTNSTLTKGVYALSATPAPGFNFTGWSTSGSVSLTSYGLLNVTAGGGAVTAEFRVAKYPVTVVCDPPTGSVVNFTGGVLASPVTLGNSNTAWLGGATLTARGVMATNTNFSGWAASPSINVSSSNPGSVRVGGPGALTLFASGFSATASVGPAAIDLGQSITVAARVVGPAPFTFTWLNLPPGCTSTDVPSFSCTPLSVGNFSVAVTVVAGDGTTRTVPAGSLQVVRDLSTTSLTATPTNFTLGGSTVLATSPSFGVLPYQFQYGGLPLGCPAAASASLSCTPTFAGVSTVALRIVDAAGYSVTTGVTVTVNPTPALGAFNLSRPVTDVGVPVVLSVWGYGGTAPLTVAFGGLPAGCTSSNVLRLVCTPAANGSFELSASVTDQDGYQSSLLHVLTVNADPQVVSLVAVGWSGYVNTSLTLSLTTAGGTGPLRISYSGLPTGCANRNTTTLACTPVAVGNYTVHVNVTDVYGHSASSDLLVTVGTPPGPPPPPTTRGGTGGVGGLPLYAWILIAAVVAVAAAAAALLARRRRTRAGSEDTVDGSNSGPEVSGTEDPPPSP